MRQRYKAVITPIFKIVAIAVMAMTLAACASGPTIESDYDRSADFSKFRTFGFAIPLSIETRNYSSIIGDHFRSAIKSELQLRGYTESNNPDLLVDVAAVFQDKTSVTQTQSMGASPYYGYRRGMYDPWHGYGYGTETHVRQYTEGTVNVDLIDIKQKRLVWEGIAKGTVKEKGREGMGQRIASGVSQMFANYPFRAGSGLPPM